MTGEIGLVASIARGHHAASALTPRERDAPRAISEPGRPATSDPHAAHRAPARAKRVPRCRESLHGWFGCYCGRSTPRIRSISSSPRMSASVRCVLACGGDGGDCTKGARGGTAVGSQTRPSISA